MAHKKKAPAKSKHSSSHKGESAIKNKMAHADGHSKSSHHKAEKKKHHGKHHHEE